MFQVGDPDHVPEHNRLLALLATDGLDEHGADLKRHDVLAVDQPGQPPVWSSALRELLLHLGDTTLVGANGGIEDVLNSILARLTALEAATPTVPGPTVPVSEGVVEVDNYSNGFVRVRDTSNLLADGQTHVVNFKVAAQAGPGGTTFPSANDIPSGSQPVWFDRNGALGYVDTAAGAHVTTTGLKSWCRGWDQTVNPHYVVLVRLTDAPGDPSKPLLIVESAVSVS